MRILARVDRLTHGNAGDAKSVGSGVWEMRLTYGPGYRVYYTRRGNRVILLLCGGGKSTQSSDISAARRLAAEWRTREGQS